MYSSDWCGCEGAKSGLEGQDIMHFINNGLPGCEDLFMLYSFLEERGRKLLLLRAQPWKLVVV